MANHCINLQKLGARLGHDAQHVVFTEQAQVVGVMQSETIVQLITGSQRQARRRSKDVSNDLDYNHSLQDRQMATCCFDPYKIFQRTVYSMLCLIGKQKCKASGQSLCESTGTLHSMLHCMLCLCCCGLC